MTERDKLKRSCAQKWPLETLSDFPNSRGNDPITQPMHAYEIQSTAPLNPELRFSLQSQLAQIEKDNELLQAVQMARAKQRQLYIDLTREDHQFRITGIHLILHQVAVDFMVSPTSIAGKTREAMIIPARFEFCKRAHDAGYSLAEIGKAINRDHGTVSYALRKIGERKGCE